jgi:hypothetical protein
MYIRVPITYIISINLPCNDESNAIYFIYKIISLNILLFKILIKLAKKIKKSATATNRLYNFLKFF